MEENKGIFYETAKEHVVFNVPIAHPEDSVSSIVERLFGKSMPVLLTLQ
ncbi:MAG: hypothetical protein N2Z80_04340 [Hydrogenothermaceae bacterium]|nr:hypothetical protein [Hydrogenothermaceae bacterium]